MDVVILAKNEMENLPRCLEALKRCNAERVFLYDSGSEDKTLQIAGEYGCNIVTYNYRDHCTAYNEITMNANLTKYVMIIDADIRVNKMLLEEIDTKIQREHFDVLKAPVKMYHVGFPLRHASLYPPKPILFKTGERYFTSIGHGERIRDGIRIITSRNRITHDDRKSYLTFLSSQVRYAEKIWFLSKNKHISWKDKIRVVSPLGALAVFMVSFFLKGGILDGKPGLVYNLDRIISELIFYRTAIAKELSEKRKRD